MANIDDSDNEFLVETISTIFTVVSSSVAAISSVLASAVNDGRSDRAPNRQKCSNRTTAWYAVEEDALYDDEWYKDQLRCSKESFDSIHKTIEEKWPDLHRKPH